MVQANIFKIKLILELEIQVIVIDYTVAKNV